MRKPLAFLLLTLLLWGGSLSCTEKANAASSDVENTSPSDAGSGNPDSGDTGGDDGGAGTGADPSEEDLEYDLFLLIGQSNMAGRGTMSEEDKTTPIEGVWLLNGDDVPEVAIAPLNKYSTIRKELAMQQIGPGNAFSLTVHQATGRKILLVVNARGGSAMNEWLPGGDYLQEAIRRTQAARQYGRLKAILWHQGESDQSTASTYLTRLSSMVGALREALGDVPFIAGEIARWNGAQGPLNAEIRRISEVIPNSGAVSSEGLTPLIDASDPHFDRNSQLQLGERYARCYFSLAGIAYGESGRSTGQTGASAEDLERVDGTW